MPVSELIDRCPECGGDWLRPEVPGPESYATESGPRFGRGIELNSLKATCANGHRYVAQDGVFHDGVRSKEPRGYAFRVLLKEDERAKWERICREDWAGDPHDPQLQAMIDAGPFGEWLEPGDDRRARR